MKRYRQRDGKPTAPPSQEAPRDSDPMYGLDQVMPPHVMDAIVGWLSSEDEGTATTSDPKKMGEGHKMASFLRFALCSKTCLGACERASLMMRTRAAVRDGNRLVGLGCESVSKVSKRGHARDLMDLETAQRFITRAVDEKNWRMSVHSSIVKAMKDEMGAKKSKIETPPHEPTKAESPTSGEGPSDFVIAGHLIVRREESVPGEDFTEINQECGAAWFYSAGSNRTERTFVYCCGEVASREDRCRDIHVKSVSAKLWYCHERCEICPPKPPGWTIATPFPVTDLPRRGRDYFLPWVLLAELEGPEDEPMEWLAFDRAKGSATKALADNERIDEFCRLANSPAATLEQRSAMLNKVVQSLEGHDLSHPLRSKFNFLFDESMKRYRLANGAPANPPRQRRQGLDQVMPPAVMDTIVGLLVLPPYRRGAPLPEPLPSGHDCSGDEPSSGLECVMTTTTTRHGKKTNNKAHKMASFFSFALCSKTCLKACERASILMRTRAAVRDSNNLAECGSHPVSRSTVTGDVRDLQRLHAAREFIVKAIDEKHWRLLVHGSILKAGAPQTSANTSMSRSGGKGKTGVVHGKAMTTGTAGSRGGFPEWQLIENDTKVTIGDRKATYQEWGALWFYSAGRDHTERTFVYCCGEMREECPPEEYDSPEYYPPDDLGDSDELLPQEEDARHREGNAMVWFCTQGSGICPPKPPGWSSGPFPAILSDKELDCDCLPWLLLAARDISAGTWSVCDSPCRGGTDGLVDSGRVDEFCRLAHSSAASAAKRRALLEQVFRCAKCAVLLATQWSGPLFP
ncbi:hypothetical protein Pelo_1313 [Pelomyxa schiedti]|nr:hypothetical protein Pelo_1313 [Pelomyxa schiedti]